MEEVFKKFNMSQRRDPVVKKTFKKVGQDIFDDDLSEFKKWIRSLSIQALYKSLIEAHTAALLEDGDGHQLHLARRCRCLYRHRRTALKLRMTDYL